MQKVQRMKLTEQDSSGIVQLPGGRLTVTYNQGQEDKSPPLLGGIMYLNRERSWDLLEILYSCELMQDEGTRTVLIETLPLDMQEDLRRNRPIYAKSDLMRIIQAAENRYENTGDFNPLDRLISAAMRLIQNPQLRARIVQYRAQYPPLGLHGFSKPE